MIKIKQKGNFSRSIEYMDKLKNKINSIDFYKYAKKGVELLEKYTPVDTGLTAKSWSYELKKTNHHVEITFLNYNVQDGVPIAIILQYGHATRNGGWVEGVDYINPALRPLFEDMLDEIEREVRML